MSESEGNDVRMCGQRLLVMSAENLNWLETRFRGSNEVLLVVEAVHASDKMRMRSVLISVIIVHMSIHSPHF